MDILRIATREGNRAYEQAEGGNEARADAYSTSYTATLTRGRKAEEIVAAGLVSPNGQAGSYYVESQNGGDTYTVNLQQNGNQWFRLGAHTFSVGTDGYIEFNNDTDDGYCNADAVRLVRDF